MDENELQIAPQKDAAAADPATPAEMPASEAPKEPTAQALEPTAKEVPAPDVPPTTPEATTTPEVIPPAIPEAQAPKTDALPGATTPEATAPSAPDQASAVLKTIRNNKGIIIAAITVLVAAIVGITAMMGSSSSEQYQGMIQKIEQQTQDLQSE